MDKSNPTDAERRIYKVTTTYAHHLRNIPVEKAGLWDDLPVGVSIG